MYIYIYISIYIYAKLRFNTPLYRCIYADPPGLPDDEKWGEDPTCWIRIHVILLRRHTSMNNVFRRLTLYMTETRTYSKLKYSHNRLNMNRVPYFLLRSAYSTCGAVG